MDFLTLAWWWNLVGLPSLIGIAMAIALWRRRSGSKIDEIALAIRRLGLVHVILALRAGVALIQELLTLRVMGIPQSFPGTGIIWPFVTLIVALALGRGLWRRSRSARRWAIGWQTIQAAIVVPVCYFLWRYQAPLELADWPDHLVSKGYPFLIIGLLLDPRIARGFKSDSEPEPSSSRPMLARAALGLLIVAGSTLAVDLGDWLARLVEE